MVQNCRIFKVNDATIWAGFQVEFYHFSVFIIMCPKIITYGLFLYIEFLGDFGHATVWKGVFDATELLESDIHKQSV